MRGIWKYGHLLPSLSPSYRISLGEGSTKFQKRDSIFIKCEYENPTGSVKDRGMAYQISKLTELGVKEAVISSSGNAAISAAVYCKLSHIKLTVFVSSHINKNKLLVLKKNKIKHIFDKRPVSSAFRFAQESGAYFLRQSTDPYASYGYETIAYELYEQNPKIDAVFIPVSSGTTLVGLAYGFLKMGYLPQLHAVQTTAVYPVASLFDKEFKIKSHSLADAIVAKFLPRRKEIIDLLLRSHGNGWVISDEEMINSRKILLTYGINCSYEGAAVLAAVYKAKNNNCQYKYPVCLLTGKFYG